MYSQILNEKLHYFQNPGFRHGFILFKIHLKYVCFIYLLLDNISQLESTLEFHSYKNLSRFRSLRKVGRSPHLFKDLGKFNSKFERRFSVRDVVDKEHWSSLLWTRKPTQIVYVILSYNFCCCCFVPCGLYPWDPQVFYVLLFKYYLFNLHLILFHFLTW